MTYSPMTIMLINMTVVFGVLGALGILMWLIHLIDPTKKKSVAKDEPAAVPVAAVTASVAADNDDEETTLLLIAAAIASYGYSLSNIVTIRPVGGDVWAQSARIETVQCRNKMF